MRTICRSMQRALTRCQERIGDRFVAHLPNGLRSCAHNKPSHCENHMLCPSNIPHIFYAGRVTTSLPAAPPPSRTEQSGCGASADFARLAAPDPPRYHRAGLRKPWFFHDSSSHNGLRGSVSIKKNDATPLDAPEPQVGSFGHQHLLGGAFASEDNIIQACSVQKAARRPVALQVQSCGH